MWQGDLMGVCRVFGQRKFDLFGLNFVDLLWMFVVMVLFVEVLSPRIILLVSCCFLFAVKITVSFGGFDSVVV